MAKVMLESQEISEMIMRRIMEFTGEVSPDPQNLRAAAAEREVLPLLCDFGGCLAIRLDGEIVSFTWDKMTDLRIESDARIRNVALFQGSKKYPELRVLIPPRPSEARECPDCNGSGSMTTAREIGLENGIVCYCGGLGWLP